MSSHDDAEEMIVACGADDAYALHLVVMLQSLCRSQSETTKIRCYIMDGGVGAANRAKVDSLIAKEKLTYSWLAVDTARLSGLMATPLLTHLSSATLLRLLLPDLLPDVDRALYIDSDVLVQGDIRAFYDTPFLGKHLVGVQDLFNPTLAYITKHEPTISAGAATFNAGVIVMSLNRFRESNGMARAMDLMTRQPSWSDQEGLNAAVAGDWVRASFVYNLQTHWIHLPGLPDSDTKRDMLAYTGKLPEDAKIAHFTGQVKPWNCGYRHPFRVAYESAMRKSGWFTPREWMQWKTRRIVQYVAERLGKR